MAKKLLIIFVSFVLLLSSPKNLFAVTDPRLPDNNKFGIHIFSEKDLQEAATLVNSTGGDWGYVTIVITESERDSGRWQKVFDQMRELHLIPIVRLATKPSGDVWNVPQEAEINNWVAFLNSLNWVVQNRYVVINNEPNHAAEWGGRVDPAGYATYLKKISQKLKSVSDDFFILPAGLDPSSVNSSASMSESRFLSQMKSWEPDVFDSIDGWTSHAYPSTGIDVYNRELSIIGRNLPVFITETGWSIDKYSEEQVSNNLVNAFTNVWSDPKVIAVTPFILDYTSPPFNNYSWKKNDGSFYSFYDKVRDLVKIKGRPKQIESGQIFAAISQPVIITGADFVGAILAKNTGQTIWTRENVSIGNESGDFKLNGFSMGDVEPMKLGLIYFRASESQSQGVYTNSLFLNGSEGQKITNSFSIEAWIPKLGKDKVLDFFSGIAKKVIGNL